MPVLFLLVIGLFDVALAYDDRLAAIDGARGGARAASVAGNNASADYQTLQAMRRSLGELGGLERIVVFKASGATATVPAACTTGTGSAANFCNVYLPSDLVRAAGDFGCGVTAPDRFWCPTSRKVNLNAALGGPPDRVGVWVKSTYAPVGGVLPAMSITATAVFRIEPASR